ncbi:MAG: sulfite exporter TauE/SafE family protein [Gemmobacter sp.]|nr:sulfite exporter TauE/SafE family protein [Gemmobacter sp.]
MTAAAVLDQALALPGLWVLALAVTLAGLVRGFAGFGSGLVYMPIAGAVLPPAQAVAVLVLIDLIGPMANVPGALRNGAGREVLILVGGMLVGVPLGIWALLALSPESFRWGTSLLGLTTVAALALGWQWRGPRGPRVTAAVGCVSGIVGGATALPGPPVILYYMASPLPVAQIRANMTLFLVLVDVMLTAMLALAGQLSVPLAMLSALLLVPFTLGNLVGSRLFHPDRVATYRTLAWVMIAASALIGLPLWDKGLAQ